MERSKEENAVGDLTNGIGRLNLGATVVRNNS